MRELLVLLWLFGLIWLMSPLSTCVILYVCVLFLLPSDFSARYVWTTIKITFHILVGVRIVLESTNASTMFSSSQAEMSFRNASTQRLLFLCGFLHLRAYACVCFRSTFHARRGVQQTFNAVVAKYHIHRVYSTNGLFQSSFTATIVWGRNQNNLNPKLKIESFVPSVCWSDSHQFGPSSWLYSNIHLSRTQHQCSCNA